MKTIWQRRIANKMKEIILTLTTHNMGEFPRSLTFHRSWGKSGDMFPPPSTALYPGPLPQTLSPPCNLDIWSAVFLLIFNASFNLSWTSWWTFDFVTLSPRCHEYLMTTGLSVIKTSGHNGWGPQLILIDEVSISMKLMMNGPNNYMWHVLSMDD